MAWYRATEPPPFHSRFGPLELRPQPLEVPADPPAGKNGSTNRRS
ncbi:MULTISPECIES: hypothetical protein [Kitasatospora]